VEIISVEAVARDLCADDGIRNGIIDGLRMRLHCYGPDNGRAEYEATLRALQAMAKLRELAARMSPRG
jgi:hypothetical protein